MEFTLLFLTKLFNILPIILKLCLSDKTKNYINLDNYVFSIKTQPNFFLELVILKVFRKNSSNRLGAFIKLYP